MGIQTYIFLFIEVLFILFLIIKNKLFSKPVEYVYHTLYILGPGLIIYYFVYKSYLVQLILFTISLNMIFFYALSQFKKVVLNQAINILFLIVSIATSYFSLNSFVVTFLGGLFSLFYFFLFVVLLHKMYESNSRISLEENWSLFIGTGIIFGVNHFIIIFFLQLVLTVLWMTIFALFDQGDRMKYNPIVLFTSSVFIYVIIITNTNITIVLFN